MPTKSFLVLRPCPVPLSSNISLQPTFDPPRTFAVAKARVASNAAELKRYGDIRMKKLILSLLAVIPAMTCAETAEELRMKGVQYAVQEDFESAEKYLCEAARMGFYAAQVECAYLLESSPEPVRDPISAYAWARVVIERDGTDSEFAQDLIDRVSQDFGDEEKREAEALAGDYVEEYVE